MMNMCHHEPSMGVPNLVSGRDQFCTCQTVVRGRLVYTRITRSEMGGE
jgi:hypothetical protein